MPPVEVPIQNNRDALPLSTPFTTHKPSLLDLPLEMRLSIYNYVFNDAIIEIRQRRPDDNNNSQDHCSVPDRNSLICKSIDTNPLYPHIWRPRTQILGACKQIRGEIIALDCCSLELNYMVHVHQEKQLQRCLSPFLWSRITTIYSSESWRWLKHFEDRPPALRHCFVNKACLPIESVATISDKFDAVLLMSYKCYEDSEDLKTMKAGARDAEIFAEAERRLSRHGRHCMDFTDRQEGHCVAGSGEVFLYTRTRVMLLPQSFKYPPRSLDWPSTVSYYSKFPQLVLLAKRIPETGGEILERRWRDSAEKGNGWECLSVNREKCSCLNAYCSTTVHNEPYCEDWYSNVTGPSV